MTTDMCFEDFERYYQSSFEADLERLKGRPFQGAFQNRNDELYYAAAYICRIEYYRAMGEEETLPPIDVSGYGVDFQIALGLAYPYVKSLLEDKPLKKRFFIDVFKYGEDTKRMRADWKYDFSVSFYFYESSLGSELYNTIRNQMLKEQLLAAEMRNIEFPAAARYKDLCYCGPVPDGFEFGIDEIIDDKDDESTWLRVVILMPSFTEAARLCCKILKNANVEDKVRIDGHNEVCSQECTIRYRPDGCKMTYRRFFDNAEDLEEIIRDVNKRYGTKYYNRENCDQECEDFPEDDYDAIRLIAEFNVPGARFLRDETIADALTRNPPSCREDLMRTYVEARCPDTTLEEFPRGLAEGLTRNVYLLAFLQAHYELNLDTEEKEIELRFC